MNKQYIRTLLDESIHAVSVIFDPQTDPDFYMEMSAPEYLKRSYASKKTVANRQKTYLYLTRQAFEKGDYLVVEARGVMQVVKAVQFHEEPPINESDTIEYKWVISKIDIKAYTDLLIAETEAMSKVTKASRGHHRKMARTALLSSFPELANLDSETTNQEG